MYPIFFEADPFSLLKKTNDYKYFIILIYDKEENLIFRNSLRRNYPEIHQLTGKLACVIDFDIPPKEWLRKYLNWFLEKYENENLQVSNFNSFEYLKELGIDAYEEMKNIYNQYDAGINSLNLKNKLLKIFNLKYSEFPLSIVLDSQDNGYYGIKKNVNIHNLNAIGMKLGRGDSIFKIDELTIEKRIHDIDPIKFFEILKKPIANIYSDLTDYVIERKATKEITESKIDKLLAKYSDFKDLKYPEKFHWKPSLEKYISKHIEYLPSFIKQVNMLETNPESRGLDVKSIKNFKRFRVNQSLRGLYYPKHNIKEFFAYGHHDIFL